MLEKINDDLVDFLPYEIDDKYIESLFSDIASLKIQTKKQIPFYENIKNSYEIWADKKGISILKEMIEYYMEKDKDLSINAYVILKYLNFYSSSIDVELRKGDILEFLEEYKKQDSYSNYLIYYKQKLELMKKKRVNDPNYLYSEERYLSFFEKFLCDELSEELEENSSIWTNTLEFGRKLSSKASDIFKMELEVYPNKLYELNSIFLNFDLNKYTKEDLYKIYGSLVSIDSRKIPSILSLLQEECNLTLSEKQHYQELLKFFKNLQSELTTDIKEITEDNYKNKISVIYDKYGLNYSKICIQNGLDQTVRPLIREYGQKDLQEKFTINSLKFMKEFILSGKTITDYCLEKKISMEAFYRFKNHLIDIGEEELVEKVEFIVARNHRRSKHLLFDLVETTAKNINEEQKNFDLLGYALKTRISLKELSCIASKLGKNKEAKLISNYINENTESFSYYNKDDYVGKFSIDGKVFDEGDHMLLEKYLYIEGLPYLTGIVVPVISKIMRNEELPTRNNKPGKIAVKK